MFVIVILSFNLFRFVQNRVCFGINGIGCCDGYFQNQTTGHCQKCPIGYYFNNCSKVCSPPNYGESCQSVCRCPYKDCHFATGCPQHIYTLTGNRLLSSTGGYTTHRTTFAVTVKALFLNVSNTTEGQDFDFSTGLNKYDVTQRKYLPPEIDLFKNVFFVQVVQVVVSLIGVFVFVFTIFTITYIYFKCFRKTSNEDEMKEKQLKAQYDSLSFGADDPESRIQPEQEEQVGTDCTYLTPVFRRSDNCDTCCSDEMVEIFKETPDCFLNRQKNHHKSSNESNVISVAEPINMYIENTQDKMEDLNFDGACQVEEKQDIAL